jgi:hypothetical protein
LAREIIWVDDASYLRRESDQLSIRPEGYVGALARAEQIGAIPIWLHTHPGEEGIPQKSDADWQVDKDIADVFRIRSASTLYGSIIVSPRDGGIAFTGSIVSEVGGSSTIDRIWQIGDQWRLTGVFDGTSPSFSTIFERSISAFGPAIQATLCSLDVAVVGCGGTGSAIAEQLVRLGVRNLRLFDSDTLTASNVTRVYGSTIADVGRNKVEILRGHLCAIAPDLKCEAINSMITREHTARELIACDLVFGCTDDNAGRLVLSRLATYLMVPVIDVGVLLSSDGAAKLSGIDARVTILSPGAACLVCRDRINLARAAAELMSPEERHRLQDEGYAPALGEVEPAVVAFTTAVAATAINELLERLIGYGERPSPSEILLRLHDREISFNNALPRGSHYCHSLSGKIGTGDTSPFLEQTWP